MDTGAEHLSTLRAYCASTRAVLLDEPGGALVDTAAGKRVALDLPGLQRVEAGAGGEAARPPLLLVYEGGRRLALSEAGIGFAPAFTNTGPLKDLPEVVRLGDYQALLGQLEHALFGLPEQPPTRDTLSLLLKCVAILDGAGAAGFDVGAEARAIEKHLVELEKRAPPREA